MKIKWFGHSCFLLESSNGKRILTDPFDGKVGYTLPQIEAHIVTTSHNHFDHNNIDLVKSSYKHIDKPGIYSEEGLEIQGIETFHDDAGGSKRGRNLMYIFTIDGIRVCHCGDLGHIPTPAQVEQVGKVDILLIPVGGIFTVDSDGALQVMKLFGPAVTIPMHFKTDALAFSLDGVNKFLAAAGGGEMAGKQEIEVCREDLESMSNIIVLNYK